MQNSVWKVTALAGVVGIGFLVVLQAQRGLSLPGLAPQETQNAADLGDAVAFDAFAEPANPAETGPEQRASSSPAENPDPFGLAQSESAAGAQVDFSAEQAIPIRQRPRAAAPSPADDPFAADSATTAAGAVESAMPTSVPIRPVAADERDQASGVELASADDLDLSDLFGEEPSLSETPPAQAEEPGPALAPVEPAPFPADIDAAPAPAESERMPRPVPGDPFAESVPIDSQAEPEHPATGESVPMLALEEPPSAARLTESESVPAADEQTPAEEPVDPGTPAVVDDPFAMQGEPAVATEEPTPASEAETEVEATDPADRALEPAEALPELAPVPEDIEPEPVRTEPMDVAADEAPADEPEIQEPPILQEQPEEPLPAPALPELEPVPTGESEAPEEAAPEIAGAGRVRLLQREPMKIQPQDGLPVITPAPTRTRQPATGTQQPTGAAGTVRVEPGDVHGEGTVRSKVPRGAQQPRLSIEKRAPAHAILGQPLVYEIHVKNYGTSPAYQVTIEDRIPQGTQLTGSIPRAELVDKRLVWKFGALEPGQEQLIKVCVVPTTEGQVGSVATVNFVAEVAAETTITAPKLDFNISAPKQVPLGGQVTFHFKVTNNGSGDATGVFIRSILPEELSHPDGNDLEYEVGVLPAGKSREISLALTAARAGEILNHTVVTADGGVTVERATPLEIIGDRLTIRRTGPEHRYVGRTAVYSNTVTNDGPRMVGGTTVVETVPPGMEFVEATAGGAYDPQTRKVQWQIEKLGPQESQVLNVTLKCAAVGTQTSTVAASTANGARVEIASETEVEGFAALGLDVPAIEGPVSVGEQVAVRVVARNRGTLPSTNVRLSVALPPELELVRIAGPVQYARTGHQIDFQPIPAVEGSAEAGFELFLKAKTAGNARLAVEIASDQLKKPLGREEIVYVLDPAE